LPLLAFALAPEELPESISIAAGKTVLRLDKAKRWYINRIDYKNRNIGLDSPGAHYGTVFYYAETKGFCGSGHAETGFVEEVKDITILQDGQEITADELKNGPVMGRKIQLEKHSIVRDFSIVYRFTLWNDILDESIEVTAAKDVNLKISYHFMHPWRKEFDEMIAIDTNDQELHYVFKSDGKFPLHSKNHPIAAWYDRESETGVVTVLLPNGKNQKNISRTVWDRDVYRKDYLVDYSNSVFPGGTTASYDVRTVFFNSPVSEWKQKATSLAGSLLKSQ
jgi:hypothetical protein